MTLTRRSLVIFASLQLLLVLAVIAITNTEVPNRVELLLVQERANTLVITGLFWLLAIVAIFAVLLIRNNWVRGFWAAVIAVSGSVAWGFKHAAQLELSIFDILSFWEARHEVERATGLYGKSFVLAGMLAAFSLVVFSLPFVSRLIDLRRYRAALVILPLLPIFAVAALVYQKQGQGYFAMPKQFSQISLAGLTAAKIALNAPKPRRELALKPDKAHAEKILYLVDESIRPDYIKLPNMHGFESFASKMVDFGPASSGGVCSNYSNAILRFAASRADLGSAINTNPTIWQYAKAAGYRTVFIDAQAQNIKNAGQLQNFMTMDELRFIDVVHKVGDVKPQDADFWLLDILEEELKKPGLVFIYANKQGAHFPYEMNFDLETAAHLPIRTNSSSDTLLTMINAYRNALDRNVDGFFVAFEKRIPLSNLSLVYTSDHGQYFEPGVATHCVASDSKPQMAYVPLFAQSSNAEIAAALRLGATKSEGRANHFMIAPALMQWMGFKTSDIVAMHPESLMTGTDLTPTYSRGDIFGLFSADVSMEPIELGSNYLEQPGQTLAGTVDSVDSQRGNLQ